MSEPRSGSPSGTDTPVPDSTGTTALGEGSLSPVTAEPPTGDAAQERHWATAAHLSGFVAAYVALGFIGPLAVLLAAGNRSPFIRRHATEALNFNLSVLLYVVVSAILVLLLIGVPMLVAIGLLYLVTTIQAALAASRGEEYRYPLTIRFIS